MVRNSVVEISRYQRKEEEEDPAGEGKENVCRGQMTSREL